MVCSCVPDTEVRLLLQKTHYGIAWTLNATGADMVAWTEMLDRLWESLNFWPCIFSLVMI